MKPQVAMKGWEEKEVQWSNGVKIGKKWRLAAFGRRLKTNREGNLRNGYVGFKQEGGKEEEMVGISSSAYRKTKKMIREIGFFGIYSYGHSNLFFNGSAKWKGSCRSCWLIVRCSKVLLIGNGESLRAKSQHPFCPQSNPSIQQHSDNNLISSFFVFISY